MAHLMRVSGYGWLVRYIAETDNLAKVRSLARLPGVRAWLPAAALSLAEAAAIQTSYDFCPTSARHGCFCQ